MDNQLQPDDIIHCPVCGRGLNFEDNFEHFKTDGLHVAWVEAHEVNEVGPYPHALTEAAIDLLDAFEDDEADEVQAVKRFNRLYTRSWRDRLAPEIETFKKAEEQMLREMDEGSSCLTCDHAAGEHADTAEAHCEVAECSCETLYFV